MRETSGKHKTNPPIFFSEEWFDNYLLEIKFNERTPDEQEIIERQLVKIIANQQYREKHEQMKKDILRLEYENEQANQKISIYIKRMLQHGKSEEYIIDVLDVSLEEVMKVKEELDNA